MASQQNTELMRSLKSILQSSEYADLTIFCGTDIHKVHKAIVCPRSDFFAEACRVGKEALKSEVTLVEDDPELVKLMIDYLYRLDYDATHELFFIKSSATPIPAINDLPVSAETDTITEPPSIDAPMAEENSWGFGEPLEPVLLARPLKTKKGKKRLGKGSWYLTEPEPALEYARAPEPEHPLEYASAPEPEHPLEYASALEPEHPLEHAPAPEPSGILAIHAQMYSLAHKYGIQGLKLLAKDKFKAAASRGWDADGFPPAVQIVYNSTPEEDTGLREVVVKIISVHMELLNKPEVEAMMRKLNGLAFDLLKCRWILN